MHGIANHEKCRTAKGGWNCIHRHHRQTKFLVVNHHELLIVDHLKDTAACNGVPMSFKKLIPAGLHGYQAFLIGSYSIQHVEAVLIVGIQDHCLSAALRQS